MKSNDRLQAVKLLTTLLSQRHSLTHLLPSNPPYTPLTRALCFGVCRHYFRLESIADTLLKKRPKPTELWVCLLVGLYQLYELNIPEYAVVQETVSVLNHLKLSWAKNLVNAILRRYCREKETLHQSLANNAAFTLGHPRWYVQRMKETWPNHWQTSLAANDTRAPMSLRVNQLCISRADYLRQLTTAGIAAFPMENSAMGIRLAEPCDVLDLPGFGEGLISVQDEAAQLAAELLALKPGLSVLDACCAPGGKTCHMLESEPDLHCLALDVDATRLQRVEENLTRLKLSATLKQGDGVNPSAWWDGKPFDRILLDAPCSATGVIRRHPDIKLLRTAEDIQRVVQLQHELLEQLWPLLAKDGLLVYATCSVMPEENNLQIQSFVARHPECQLIQIQKSWGQLLSHGRQILPGEQDMDGFFYSIIKKTS